MVNFVKHLPPSLNRPRVLALDAAAAVSLPPEVEIVADAEAPAPFDAIVGEADPTGLERWFSRLRPGGRLILAARAEPQTLLEALVRAGFIHCLVETEHDLSLYRGERPPRDRLAHLSRDPAGTGHSQISNAHAHLYLLIAQTPNKPVWQLAPGEKLHWQAATLLDSATGQPTLLAFGSLVKAVAFMQPAVLAQKIKGVNKVGKFSAAVVQQLNLSLALNPVFDDWRRALAGPWIEVEAQLAVTGEE